MGNYRDISVISNLGYLEHPQILEHKIISVKSNLELERDSSGGSDATDGNVGFVLHIS